MITPDHMGLCLHPNCLCENREAPMAGLYQTAALRDDGVVEAWGDDNSGQAPQEKHAAVGRFVGICAGSDHRAGLRDDGIVEAW